MIKKHRTRILNVLVVGALLCSSSAALARPGDYDYGHDRNRENREVREYHDAREYRDHDRRHDRQNARIYESDRKVIQRYMTDYHYPRYGRHHYSRHRHYVVGRRLPGYIDWRPLPRPLLVKMRPAPWGYRYVMVDDDVLLISEATREIMDALILLSAVGRY